MTQSPNNSPSPMSAVYLGALLILGLGIAALFALDDVSVDNRLEKWANADDSASERYAEFVSLFGSDEFIVVALSGRPLFDEASLDAMVFAVEEMERLPGVEQVSGIPVVYRDHFGLEDAEALHEEIVHTPYYRHLYLSDDEAVAALIIQTGIQDEADARRQTLDGVFHAVDGLRVAGFQVHTVGPSVLNLSLDDLSRTAVMRTLPIAIAGSLLLLVVLLGSLRAALVPIVSSGLTVVIVFGAMALLDHPLTMLTTALPALLLVLSLGNGVHLLRRYKLSIAENRGHAESVAIALRETAFPNALSSLTTAGGFLSLLMANMVPVQEFGIVAAAGMLVNLLVSLTVGPLMLRICRPPRLRRDAQVAGSLVRGHHTVAILVASACVLVVSGIGVLNVKTETDPLSFFPDNAEIVEAYEFVSQNLAGIYSLEVVLKLPGPWTDTAQWPHIETVRKALEDNPMVTRALNPLDVLRLLNHWENDLSPDAYTLPESEAVAHGHLADLEPAERRALQRYVSPSGDTIRLSALVNDMDSERFLELVRQLDKTLASLPLDLQGYSTGVVLDIVTAQEALIGAQRRSLLLASGIVLVCLLLGLRSFRLMLIAIIPNGLPLLVMFGTMGLLGLKLDPATAMVASVALGIAVDDTVHLLVAYARERRRGVDVGSSMAVALGTVGEALKITTAVACFGFLILLLSSFSPIRYFGFLATIGMIVALLADLYIVPALIVIGAVHSKERTRWCPSSLHT